MKRLIFGAVLASIVAWSTSNLAAFCGFYVSKADTKLFNKASQVVLVRDGDRTVMTMANDFKGELKEFAVVIPVPTFLRREQIHVGEKSLIDHLDAYSAPRLVDCGHLRRKPARDSISPRTREASASPSRRSTRSASTTS